jgi:hypothetical protein
LKYRVKAMQEHKKDKDDSHASLFKVREEFIFVFGGSTIDALNLEKDISHSFDLEEEINVQAVFTID